MDRKGCARFSRSESRNGFSSLMAIRRVLIANRGEIAVRIARACREASIESVAVYSDADKDALHVRVADRAVRIGPAAPAESYLSVPALIAAAASSEADAIHPGYGFLSERAALPLACEEAGLIFIGPPAQRDGADGIEDRGARIDAERGRPNRAGRHAARSVRRRRTRRGPRPGLSGAGESLRRWRRQGHADREA